MQENTQGVLPLTKGIDYEAVWRSLMGEAASIGWPEVFRADLEVHDRDHLRQYAPRFFGWILEAAATHILEGGSSSEGLLRYYERGGPKSARFYFWTPESGLRRVSGPDGLRTMLEAAKRNHEGTAFKTWCGFNSDEGPIGPWTEGAVVHAHSLAEALEAARARFRGAIPVKVEDEDGVVHLAS